MREKGFKRLFCVAMAAGLLVGCGKSDNGGQDSDTGSVYYMNFKPEVASVWEEIALCYEQETGVPVKVVTAAGGNYESTLKAEIVKSDAPTLFQVNGPIGYQAWKDYCADLSRTKFYEALSDKELALKGEDGGVYGVPYTMEGYGIIYNKEIMNRYFATTGAKAGSIEEIKDFNILKAVAEDMQSKKEELGIKGVFAATSLQPNEDWRWHTHLANLAVYAEYQKNNVTDMQELEFTYQENFKKLFDLYVKNSTIEQKLLGSKGVNDSMAEFALGQCAMVQNGNWAWAQIAEVSGNVVKEENIGFLPLYMGLESEENQGLCVGTENYFCINSQASEVDRKATEDFVYWLISSPKGKDYMINKLGNVAPFNTFTEEEKPEDPLAKSMLKSMEEGKISIPWIFTTFPSQTFKEQFGGALLEYVQGTMRWEEVVKTVQEQWKAEKEILAE